jgi:hypothetical protein
MVVWKNRIVNVLYIRNRESNITACCWRFRIKNLWSVTETPEQISSHRRFSRFNLSVSPSVAGGGQLTWPQRSGSGKWNLCSEGKPEILNETFEISGKFQRIIPPWIPPQLWQPANAGITVMVTSYILKCSRRSSKYYSSNLGPNDFPSWLFDKSSNKHIMVR